MRKILFGFVLSLVLTSPVWAQQGRVVELPSGQTALNISATERLEVAQDLLVASLRIQDEAKQAKQVQETINKAMKEAVAEIKKYSSIKVQTGQYYVNPDYRYINRPDENNKRILDKWRGSQTIIIKSKKSDEILEVTGKLQDMGFVMNSLSYQLSPEKYDEVRDNLMETTIKALMARAKRVAKALGKDNVDLVEINIDASRQNMPPVAYARGAQMEMMAVSADKAMAAPVAEAGESMVSMTINAQAIIKP